MEAIGAEGDMENRDGEIEIGNTSAQAHMKVSLIWAMEIPFVVERKCGPISLHDPLLETDGCTTLTTTLDMDLN